MTATILLADNDPDFRQTRAEVLKRLNYNVLLADNPIDTRKLFATKKIDLAILDIRLQDDDDEKDVSGLTIAKEVAPTVPKIMLTNFPSVDTVRESLRPHLNELPPAVDFVAKEEGINKMISIVERSITTHLEKKRKPGLFDISEQLKQNFDEVRKQASTTHLIRLFFVAVGGFVIILGTILLLLGYTTAGTASTVSGIITEAVALLSARFSKTANERMDDYQEKLLKLHKSHNEETMEEVG